MDKNLITQFKSLLDDPNSNENDAQRFLEENTQLVPLPILENHNLHMNVVISKYVLGNEYKTDFAYLTKSSNLWRVVLMELENQHKKIFKQSNEIIEFSAEFTKGLNQIHSWQVYVENNKQKILNQLEKIRCPLSNNITYFDYVLIIGRNDELNDKKRSMLANLMEREKITVMTYDSLISRYSNFSGIDKEKVILSPWREQGFSIKELPKSEIDTSIFTIISPEYLKVSNEQESRLKTEGFEINEWKNGFRLILNNKKSKDLLGNKTKF